MSIKWLFKYGGLEGQNTAAFHQIQHFLFVLRKMVSCFDLQGHRTLDLFLFPMIVFFFFFFLNRYSWRRLKKSGRITSASGSSVTSAGKCKWEACVCLKSRSRCFKQCLYNPAPITKLDRCSNSTVQLYFPGDHCQKVKKNNKTSDGVNTHSSHSQSDSKVVFFPVLPPFLCVFLFSPSDT